jgi:type IV pilus assembly protein PilA
MRSATAAFTLIELMVVVTILAIIASIAIPSMMSARSTANEKSVIATMRAIVTAQQLAHTNAMIDLNRNGQGEGASLPELAGAQVLRGSSSVLRPAYLSASFGDLDSDGYASSHGFYFALYLPDATGAGVVAMPANLGNIDAQNAEHFWTCLAWPRDRQLQGYGTFFTNQSGDILVCKNATYSGKTSVPPPGAALVGGTPDRIDRSETAAAGGAAADGNPWRIVP